MPLKASFEALADYPLDEAGTTYRNMAQDCVDQAATLAGLETMPCTTTDLRVHGYYQEPGRLGVLASYGADAAAIDELCAEPGLGEQLHPELSTRSGEVLWAVRQEMCRTVDDFLARRTRTLFLNARAAIAMAPEVARLMAGELGRDEQWQQEQTNAFQQLAQAYLP